MMETTIEFWWRWTAVLAAEVSIIVLAAFAFQRFVRSAAWRQAIWQACVLGVLTLLAVELSGASRVLTDWMKPRPSVPLTGATAQTAISVAFPEGEPESTISASASAVPAARPETWWPGIIWLAGFALLIARMLFVRLFFLLRAERSRVHDPQILERVRELSVRLRVRGRVAVFEMNRLRGPIAFGIVRPSIGLPPDFATFTRREQEAMLIHELAHLAARDPVWYALVEILAALMWWHPLVWWVRLRLHNATEAAADEASVLVEDGPNILAEALVRLGNRLLERQRLGLLGIHGNGFRSHLGRRVERLISMTREHWSPLPARRSFLAKTVGPAFLATAAVCCCAWMPQAESKRPLAALGFAAFVDAFQSPQESAAPLRPSQQSAQPQNPPNDATQTALHTRTFRVDPVTFIKGLEEATAAQVPVGELVPRIDPKAPALESLRRLLRDAGVEPKSLFWNDRLGMLMVRAPVGELEIVEQIVQSLNAAPPQVTIEVKIAEMPEGSAKSLGLDWLGAQVKSTLSRNQPQSPSVDTNLAVANPASVLTAEQSRAVFRALEQRAGIDLLSAPRITTLSSRQAQIKVVEIRSVATGAAERPDRAGVHDLVVTQHECGPSIDAIPVVRADGLTIDLTLIASFREFLGYEDTTQVVNILHEDGSVVSAKKPLPRFRAHQAVAHPTIVDGQTVAIGMGTSEGKQRVGFCTVTIIDPAGNRVRND